MSPSSLLFLVVRVLHVLLAAVWLGSAIYATYFLAPAVAEAGPAGGQVMAGILRRGVSRFLGIVAALTVLTGIYLYWRFTGGFDPGVSGSRTGIVFGTGGLAGILAGVVGGAVVGRSAGQMEVAGASLARAGEGPERAALLQRMNTLRGRMATGSRILIALQIIALVLMAIGHYV